MKVKWNCFWRLFLLWFTILSIWFIGGFVNYSSATVQEIWFSSVPSSVDNNFEITALAKWRAITNYLWVWKWLIAISNWRLFFWSTNWFPYLYYSSSLQWYFKFYYLCDVLTSSSTAPTNCHSYSLDSDSIVWVRNFFDNVVNWDYFYYSYSTSSSSSLFRYCWSSSSYWSSLCFRYEGTSSLRDSLGYSWLNFSSISASIYQNWPFWSSSWGWNITWSSSEWLNASITWNVVYSPCTIWSVVSYLNTKWFNSKVCYAWVSSLDWTWIIINTPWTWITFRQLYENTHEGRNFNEWLVYWNWVYNQRYVLAENPFNNYTPWLYYYFENINNYWSFMLNSLSDYSTDLYHYCMLEVYWDKNSIYSWNHFDFLRCNTNWTVVSNVYADTYNNSYFVDWNSYYANGSDWSWIWDMGSWNSSWTKVYDSVAFINNFFNLVKSKVIIPDKNWLGLWFLPSYIITFLCALILFRFISH